MNTLSILLAAQAGGPSMINTIVMFGLIMIIFYFFMIRPQRKKMNDAKKFMENLEKGQRIVTIGGIHGKIDEIKDTTVIITVEGGTKLKLEKRAISPDSSLLTPDAK